MSSPKPERMPPLSLQFQQGAYAFTRGWIANDYRGDTIKAKEWQRGWNAAYFNQMDKVAKKA
jgi:hypothetical protein